MIRNLKLSRWLIALVALALIWCVLLALNVIPELRGDFGWRWPYELPQWARLVPLIISLIVYIGLAQRLADGRAIQALAFLGAVLLPVACLFVLGDPLYLLITRTLSGL